MDKIKLLTYSVIGLVLLNIGIISFLYLSRPHPDNNRRKPKDIISEKLHFDADQIKEYDKLIQLHRSHIIEKEDIIRKDKNELYLQLNENSVNLLIESEINNKINRIT